MIFKKWIISLILLTSILASSLEAFALDIKINWVEWNTINIDSIKNISLKNFVNNKEITRKDFFIFLSNNLKDNIPETYKYINLKFIDINWDKDLQNALQVLVYLDVIENKSMKLYYNKPLNASTFYNFIENKFDFYAVPTNETESDLNLRNTNFSDLENVENAFDKQNSLNEEIIETDPLSQKKEIFWDVYKTLLSSHIDKNKLEWWKLIDSAIEWLAKWTWDKFTTYFPPTETKAFEEDLNQKYEWIWAYVDMENPWEFKIISPISWTPSEKAWLKWWDIVLEVNGKLITKENTLKEVVTWVKWPAWTKVTLKIKRWEEIFDVDIIRAKIVINEVITKVINDSTFYIQITTFWDSVKNEFVDAINKLKQNWNTKNLIIDLRNNPWGYLDQVTDILSYFVEKDEPTAIVKYIDYQVAYKSRWNNLIDFSKYKIIILENWWTASASEIMIWTIKDYYPNATIIWEKSYWKWSVQTIKPFSDWSTLKFTIAKWYTWKSLTWIDWVWISPDINLILDEEKIKAWVDSQLEKAIELTR